MVESFRQKHERYFQIEGIETSNKQVFAGFSSRHGGCSNSPFQSLNLGLHVNDEPDKVIENRKRLAESIGTTLDQWIFADQVHDKVVQEVTTKDHGKGSISYNTGIMGTDGLYTKDPNTVLALGYADCVPIYFVSKNHSIIGVVHAGWKGTVSGIAQEMISKWENHEHVPASDIEVWIGPSIQQCCYEVDERVISHVDEILPDNYEKPYSTKSEGKYMLNLQLLNKQLLLQAGIREEYIHVTDHCTSCGVEDFFSHRKENGSTGRMLAFIMMKE